MQTIDLLELESGGHFAIREIQLAHIKECSRINLQWIFKTNNLEIARLLAERILTISVVVMNGELCVGVGFLIRIESPKWVIQDYIS
jgi:hypothetical protein